jgi:hypothetical protein
VRPRPRASCVACVMGCLTSRRSAQERNSGDGSAREINPGNTMKTTVPFDVSKRAKPDYLLLKAGVWGFSDGVRVKL